jgi:hypothetical protein
MKTKKKHFGQSINIKKLSDANALKRVQIACEMLVGSGFFELFDASETAYLVNSRFGAVKIKLAPSNGISAKQATEYEMAFKNLLNKNGVGTLAGSIMPLDLYLREGLTIIRYIELRSKTNNPCNAILTSAFSPWIEKDKFYEKICFEIIRQFERFTMILSNWSSEIFLMNIDQLAVFSYIAGDNSVLCQSLKLPSENLTIDGSTRKIIAVGWPDFDGIPRYVFLTPTQLGITENKDLKVQVYIQVHALIRLQERLGIVPGIIHKAIYDALVCKTPLFTVNSKSYLLAIYIFSKKVGYLKCDLISGKLIIRTFLFITNDGTPEGKKLNELTKLAKLDKMYLKIDSLEGFLGLNISESACLQQIFSVSGCSDLLDLTILKPFYRYGIAYRSNKELLKYLVITGNKLGYV